MTKLLKKLADTTQAGLLTLLVALLSVTAQAAHHEEGEAAPQEQEANVRSMAISMEAEVVAINLETREISLMGPTGDTVTMHAPEQVVKLEEISVGDLIVTTYAAALEGEVREPTPEELAEPWVVIEDAGMSEEGEPAAVGSARMIRAVCTIEGMNRELGTVMIKGPRGNLHVIGDVEPEKMDGVVLGQTIVMVYVEAMALTLEKKADAAEE